MVIKSLEESQAAGLVRRIHLPKDRQRFGNSNSQSLTFTHFYVSFDLLAAGTFLIQGRLIFLLLALGLGGLLHVQIRREERFLAEFYGDAYREYCARVGRYLKWR